MPPAQNSSDERQDSTDNPSVLHETFWHIHSKLLLRYAIRCIVKCNRITFHTRHTLVNYVFEPFKVLLTRRFPRLNRRSNQNKQVELEQKWKLLSNIQSIQQYQKSLNREAIVPPCTQCTCENGIEKRGEVGQMGTVHTNVPIPTLNLLLHVRRKKRRIRLQKL